MTSEVLLVVRCLIDEAAAGGGVRDATREWKRATSGAAEHVGMNASGQSQTVGGLM